MSTRGMVVRRRLQGLAFLVVLVLLLALAVAVYQKAFTEVARVTLRTDTVGYQLQEASDVKVRGVIVGDVREVRATTDGAEIELAIRPEHLAQIPADVTARLLPKTLFGERFVSLELPEQPSAERLADGDVIGQDRGVARAVRARPVPGRDHRHLRAGVGHDQLRGRRRRAPAKQRRPGHRTLVVFGQYVVRSVNTGQQQPPEGSECQVTPEGAQSCVQTVQVRMVTVDGEWQISELTLLTTS